MRNDQDPRHVGAYPLSEAAHYLRIPSATLSYWARAAPRVPAIIELPNPENRLLSFRNLVEAHVLSAIRRQHRISLQATRRAVRFLRKEFDTRHPFADRDLETDGIDLFVEILGKTVSATRDGQVVMRDVMRAFLRRIDRDPEGIARRLYPFTRRDLEAELRSVVIDPWVSFGRPVIAGTGIRTDVILNRFLAGESSDELAEDYGRTKEEIDEAIRWEALREAA